ncbi:MAG: VCBS repeat-containing protein [Planctomycetes bacterium]|nr:VCBS repeat-containing protein [Planctomycetota bacterium]
MPLLFLGSAAALAQTVSFDPAADYPVASGPTYVAVGDFNGDGKHDLAVANFGANHVSILLGTGTGTLGPAALLVAGTGPNSIAVGDFNTESRVLGFQGQSLAAEPRPDQRGSDGHGHRQLR